MIAKRCCCARVGHPLMASHCMREPGVQARTCQWYTLYTDAVGSESAKRFSPPSESRTGNEAHGHHDAGTRRPARQTASGVLTVTPCRPREAA
eukprot:3474949-Rhodomonas_salina.1